MCVCVCGGEVSRILFIKLKEESNNNNNNNNAWSLKTSILPIAPVSYDSPPALPSGKGSVSL